MNFIKTFGSKTTVPLARADWEWLYVFLDVYVLTAQPINLATSAGMYDHAALRM